MPTRSGPAAPSARAAMSACAASSWATIASACRRRSRPASVTSTGLGPPGRSTRRCPTVRSSCAICWLTADCVYPRSGAALLVVDTGGVAWAEQRVASGLAALLIASVPLFMAVLDRAFFGVRLPLGAAAGIATGLLGVALLVGPSGRIDAVGGAVLLVA